MIPHPKFFQFACCVAAGCLASSIGLPTIFAQEAASTKSANAGERCWNQWRGPNRDGKIESSNSDSWPSKFDDDHLRQTWRIELGPSYSGPVMSDKFVFTTETVDEQRESVRAIDRKTGEQRWEVSWEGAMKVPFFARANGDWIRSTPAYVGGRLYVGGMRDVLVCLSGSDGKELWRVDFVQQTGSSLPTFGFVSSPLVADGHVFVQAGGGLCKLDAKTGKLVWKSLDDGGGMNGSAFSSPVLVELNGRRQLVVQTRERLAGVDPDSGDELWSRKIKAFRGMNILTPVVYQGDLFTSAYGGASHRFDISPADGADSDAGSGAMAVKEVWTGRQTGYMSSPIVIGDHLYLHLRNQRFTCIDLKTGESTWTTKPFGKYWSMVASGNRILALDERGDLYLIDADPTEFKLVDSRKIVDSPSWAHLAVCEDEILIRDLEGLSSWKWGATSDGNASAETNDSPSDGDQ